MLAVDFFTVETIWVQRLYVLFFIELVPPLSTSRAARQIRPRPVDQGQLERIAAVFVDHDNVHRPHGALALNPPDQTSPPLVVELEPGGTGIQRRHRLGGVVHEYSRAA
jgi:hypothetical protein